LRVFYGLLMLVIYVKALPKAWPKPSYYSLQVANMQPTRSSTVQYESSIVAKVGRSDFSALDNAKYVKMCLVRIGNL
jgi:hypothetical protein